MGTNSIYGAVILLLLLVGSFFFGRATTARDAEVKRDTVYKYDTITKWLPQPTSSKITGTQKVKAVAVKPQPQLPNTLPNTLSNCSSEIERMDSIATPKQEQLDSAEVELPITERTYVDEEYKAVVQGYNPILKSIEVYPRTAYITTTETIKERKRWGVSLGVQGGYGITPQGMQPYVGVGISFGYSF